MRNILVIGGSYFVGKVFVEELRNRSEYAIYVVNRGNRPLNLEGVKEIVCERHDTIALKQLVPPLEWHAVVDFCAYEPSDVEMLLQNVPGSVQQYIYFSTCTVYQDSVHIPMAEDSPKLTGPLPGPHGDYGYKKWLAELKLEELSKKKGMAYTILRPAFIYGKYNYAPRESYFFELIKEQKPIIVPSLPQALFTVVSVWDVANITIACLGNKKVFDNAFNLSAEELISYDKLVEVLQEITSSSFKVQRLGIAQIYAQGIPLPYPLTQHLVYSGTLIQEVLNYQYMPFLEGMTKTYKHYFNI